MKTEKEGIDLAIWPWQRGEKPYFVNEQGYEWYVDKSLTDWATSETRLVGKPLKAVCFYVVKDKEPITRILIGVNQEILYENPKLDDMACYIDFLRLAKKQEEEK